MSDVQRNYDVLYIILQSVNDRVPSKHWLASIVLHLNAILDGALLLNNAVLYCCTVECRVAILESRFKLPKDGAPTWGPDIV